MSIKEEFQKGCEGSGGSFVENPDGTWQCNTTSGIIIRCVEDGTKCWIPVRIAPEVHITVGVDLEGIPALFAIPAPTKLPAPTKEGLTPDSPGYDELPSTRRG